MSIDDSLVDDEIKDIDRQLKKAVKEENYSLANDLLDRTYYLRLTSLFEYGINLSEREKWFSGLSDEQKIIVKPLLDDFRESYKAFEKRLKDMREKEIKYGMINAPID